MRSTFWACAVLMFPMFVLPLHAADKPSTSAPPATAAAQYVGSDTCLGCHEEVYKNQFERTPHFQTVKNGHGCESCHGPGSEHVAGGGDKSKIISFAKLSRAESNNQCLECHGNSKAQHFSKSSAHATNQVGCIDCHSPHHAVEEQHLLVKKQPDLCYSCHATRARRVRAPLSPSRERRSGRMFGLP